MSGLTYDTGALIAAAAGRSELWTLHQGALRRGIRPVVPAGVLAQAWRGGPQGSLACLLRGCLVEALSESRARLAGIACSRSRTSDVVVASVAIGALSRDDVVVTSDPDDLVRIAQALGQHLRVRRV